MSYCGDVFNISGKLAFKTESMCYRAARVVEAFTGAGKGGLQRLPSF